MKLKDNVAIVTGGPRRIGEAIVRAYAAEGAHVVIADIEIAKPGCGPPDLDRRKVLIARKYAVEFEGLYANSGENHRGC